MHELGAKAYGEVLAEHRRVLRDAFAAYGGVEVDTQGESVREASRTAAVDFGALPSDSAIASYPRDKNARSKDRLVEGLEQSWPKTLEPEATQ